MCLIKTRLGSLRPLGVMWLFAPYSLILLSLSSATSHQQPFVLEAQPLQQPGAGKAPSDPSGPLPWSDLNILHTTDTHGPWLSTLSRPSMAEA